MPRFWLSGPRLFNGLVRPGISFSGRDLKALGWKAPKVSEDATLGICRRPDGAMTLAIPGKNGEAEHEPGLVPVAAFFFSRVDDMPSRFETALCSGWAAVSAPMVGYPINRLAKSPKPSRPRLRRLVLSCRGPG
jgi:hypothetical protein